MEIKIDADELRPIINKLVKEAIATQLGDATSQCNKHGTKWVEAETQALEHFLDVALAKWATHFRRSPKSIAWKIYTHRMIQRSM